MRTLIVLPSAKYFATLTLTLLVGRRDAGGVYQCQTIESGSFFRVVKYVEAFVIVDDRDQHFPLFHRVTEE